MTDRQPDDYRNRCELCDELVADDEVIAVNSDAGLVAHDYHSASAVRAARSDAGADPSTGRMIAPSDEWCDIAARYHRGARICNAEEVHDNRHDGYADNAEAYLAGWNISGSAILGMDPSGAVKHYTAHAGPDRLAFTAGWIERQEQRIAARRTAPTFGADPLTPLPINEPSDAQDDDDSNGERAAIESPDDPRDGLELESADDETTDEYDEYDDQRTTEEYAERARIADTCRNCGTFPNLQPCAVCATFGAHEAPCYHAPDTFGHMALDALDALTRAYLENGCSKLTAEQYAADALADTYKPAPIVRRVLNDRATLTIDQPADTDTDGTRAFFAALEDEGIL